VLDCNDYVQPYIPEFSGRARYCVYEHVDDGWVWAFERDDARKTTPHRGLSELWMALRDWFPVDRILV